MKPTAALDQGKRVWPAPVSSYLAPARNRTYNIPSNRAGTGTYIFIAIDTIKITTTKHWWRRLEKENHFRHPFQVLCHVIDTCISILKQNRRFRILGNWEYRTGNGEGISKFDVTCNLLISQITSNDTGASKLQARHRHCLWVHRP